jgi:GrpB-like predicted nucleotidyltransferase (UPF0157 family)
MRIVIFEYDPNWVTDFERMRSELSAILSHLPIIDIIHVGSTSIPNLAAKPIIDIDIICPPPHVFQAMSALSKNGYTYNPEPNSMDRASFRYNAHAHDSGAAKQTEDGKIRRQVYLNIPGGVKLTHHLEVKRVLERDEGLVREYSEVKRGLAGVEHKDIGAYGNAKSEILKKIIARGKELDEGSAETPDS